jgi:hypothetical protein
VREEATRLVDDAVDELEKVELNGMRPTLISLARTVVDRDS